MRRIVTILALGAVCVGAGNPQPAYADSLMICTDDFVDLTSFGPCVFQGNKVLSDFKATLGGMDVTRADFLGVSAPAEDNPKLERAPFLAFGQPLPFQQPAAPQISPSNPLVISFHVAALEPGTALSGATEILFPSSEIGRPSDFHGLLSSEFRKGTFSTTARLGTGLDGTPLPQQTFVRLGGVPALDVISTITDATNNGSGFAFAFDLTAA